MHLKSLTLKGFKSFPDRARLDFGPGVSVVVGPNGSGKSNVTDAVLWALGEQSPLAVRGQSMQDVIFGGGRGVKASSSAEVELVLDNSDGTVAVPLSEISIRRRLERTGEGEYRMNGARCRLADVLELLSDTGLGKETHSVISQGRVEEIVTSKPRDRRLLIEEAAGLGKHRKRRRRAQLKLEHTQENLDRALDVEREARARLRPLKRQAEAAELHERLERQMLEIRFELARRASGAAQEQLGSAEADVARAREGRAAVEAGLREVSERRGRAEQALAERVQQREILARRVYSTRAAAERLGLRVEQTRRTSEDLEGRVASAAEELELLLQMDAGEFGSGEPAQSAGDDRIAVLEQQLAELDEQRERELVSALGDLRGERQRAAEELGRCRGAVAGAAADRERLDAEAEHERSQLRESERELDGARRAAARVGAELAAVNQFLRSHASRPRAAHAAGDGPRSLSEALRVRPGYELALAAVLGERLEAALASDLASAQQLLDGAGPDGAAALLAGSAGRSRAGAENGAGRGPAARGLDGPPVAGAEPLASVLSAPPVIAELAGRLLRDAWVVERLEDLPADYGGTAVTRTGRVWFGAWGEVRQVNEGGSERVLAQHNERERLIAESEQVASREHAARVRAERLREGLLGGEPVREQAERAVRERERELAEAAEALRRADWVIEQRRSAPEEGPLAIRRAELQGELAAERRQAERDARERDRRLKRIGQLRARQAADSELLPRARRLLRALQALAEAAAARAGELDERLARDRDAGEEMGAELRTCATFEADLQIRLRAEGERVTSAEVAAQRLRDLLAESELELRSLAARLQLDLSSVAAVEPLADERADQLGERLQRLERRGQQLGPVNPLAQEEYAEALAHVVELEGRRGDLETALRELQTLIRDADRQIEEVFEETFDAAARNFDELVGDLFPGGSGRLRLVDEGLSRRAILGGQVPPAEGDPDEEPGLDEAPSEDLRGVEIELTPAGKSTKRLSLLSGGEKAMTALAFLFSVILARPCPFYILDEVEAALDDHNLGRFLNLLRRHGDRAQFIVITHQQRTMEAADWLYGVSMGGDGVSKVLSRRLPAPPEPSGAAAAA